MATKLSMELDCGNLIDGIDKSAAKFEEFSGKAKKSIDAIEKNTSKMSDTQLRAYEALKKSFEKHQSELLKVTKRYEELRAKQKQNIQLTEDETFELVGLSGEYRKHAGAAATLSSELGRLSRGFANIHGALANLKSLNFQNVLGGILGGAGAIMTAKVTTFATDSIKAMVELGTIAQQLSSQFAAMTGSVEKGTAAYEIFNDVSRNTNYDQAAVMNMGKELMNMGYSAQNAAELIALCADAAAGLGQGADGAQRLVDIISKIQSTGKLSTKDVESLAEAGLDMEQVFSNMGMTAGQAMTGLQKGTVDSQMAIAALVQYLHTFDGKMAESQNNIVDQWNGITGNLQESCAQIGKFISDAFMKADVLSGLIDLTQVFIDIIRGEGCGVFKELGNAIKWAFGLVSPMVKIIVDGIKLLLVIVNELGEGFTNVCKAIYDKLSWILEPLTRVASVLSDIFTALGKQIDTEINESFKQTFSSNSVGGTGDVEGTDNNFRTSLSAMVAEETEAADNLTTAYGKVANAQTAMLNNSTQLAAQSKTTINWAGELTNAFSKMGSDILKNGINFMDGLKNAFKSFAESVINQLMNIAMKALIVNALTGLFGGGGGGVISGEQFGLGKVPSFGFADGGFVSGEGTSTSDSIPAMLSNGEYVLNADAVAMVGRSRLDAINSGVRHYASGGFVGGIEGGLSGRSVVLNISAMDASGFAEYLAKGGLDVVKQALFDDDRGFGSAVGVW